MPISCIPVSSKKTRRSLRRFHGKTQHAMKLIVLPRPTFVFPRSRPDEPKRFNRRRSAGGSGLTRSSSRQSGTSRGRFSASPPGTIRSRTFLSAEDARDRRFSWSREVSRSPSSSYDVSQNSIETRSRGTAQEGDGSEYSKSRVQHTRDLSSDEGRTRTLSEPIRGTPSAVQPKAGSTASQFMPCPSGHYLMALEDVSYQSMVSGATPAKLLTPIIEDVDIFGERIHSSLGSSFGRAKVLPPDQDDPFLDEVQSVHSDPTTGFTQKVSANYIPPNEQAEQSLRSSTSISVHIGHSSALGEAESLPSFVLTIPTPVLDRSPFFPESFSMQSFVMPLDPTVPHSPTSSSYTRLSSTPPLTQFNRTVPADELCTCEECETQNLPRQTWLQDTAARQLESQDEPRADNTIFTAAVMDMLGLFAGERPNTQNLSEGLGLNIGDGRASPSSEGRTQDLDNVNAKPAPNANNTFSPRTNARPKSRKVWSRLAGLVRRRRGRLEQGQAKRVFFFRNSGLARASFLDLDSHHKARR